MAGECGGDKEAEMNANNGWPGKPGVPLNPEEPRWHWVRRIENNRPFPLEWTNDWNGGRDFCWAIMGSGEPEDVAKNICYLGPCLTPDEATALQARVAELEGLAYGLMLAMSASGHDFTDILREARAALEGKKDE